MVFPSFSCSIDTNLKNKEHPLHFYGVLRVKWPQLQTH